MTTEAKAEEPANVATLIDEAVNELVIESEAILTQKTAARLLISELLDNR